ncbi:hypothetical protein GCM10009551_054290 [Nocardiopsis tropica]
MAHRLLTRHGATHHGGPVGVPTPNTDPEPDRTRTTPWGVHGAAPCGPHSMSGSLRSRTPNPLKGAARRPWPGPQGGW